MLLLLYIIQLKFKLILLFFQKFKVTFSQTNDRYSNFGAYHINNSNFYLGVQGLKFDYSTSSFFYDFFNDFNGNMVQLNANFPPLNFISTYIIKVQKWDCLNTDYLYYMGWSHLCYDICPKVRYFGDSTTLRCISCLYDCYTCANSISCTSCNSTYNFREEYQLNGTLRCKPIKGYFNANTYETRAQKCDINCVECNVTATNCVTCKTAQYLSVVNLVGNCLPCVDHCTMCYSQNCDICQNMYILSSVGLCIPDCSLYCQVCHIQKTPIQASVCDNCLIGFYINQSLTSQCYSTCGDGIYAQQLQKCDDNNTQNGDGCSSECIQQLGFKCYLINNDPLTPHLCYYQKQIRFIFSNLKKKTKKNIFTFDLSISTLNPVVLKQLDWLKIIMIDIQYISFTLVNKIQTFLDSYQSTINTLILSFQVQYTSIIKNTVEVKIDPKRNYQPQESSQIKIATSNIDNQQFSKQVTTVLINTQKFDTTPITKDSYPLKSENGMAIIYEADNILSMSKILDYSLLIITVIGLLSLLFSFSVYGGKIIVLEFIFIVNCAYYSLVGFKNIQVYSTIQSLSSLKYISLNFNSIYYQSNNKLWWTGIDQSFIRNCVIQISLLIIPILISISSLFLPKCVKNQETLKNLMFLKKYGIGQLLMTFYLFSAYSFTVNLILSFMSIIKSQNSDIFGIVLGTLLLGVGIFTFVFLIKRKTYFWQFVDSFFKVGIPEYYMNLNLIVIWINSISLVVLSDIPYGNIIPIVCSVVWIGLLIKVKLFKKQSQRKRPIIIQVFSILIQLIFVSLKAQINSNQKLNQLPIILLYIPFCIPIFLLLALGYTIWCLITKIKTSINDRTQFLQNQKLFRNILKTPSQQKALDLSIQQTGFANQIMQSFRKQKGFNFLSHQLTYDKKQLDQKWNNLQNIETQKIDLQKIKQIKKQIKKSVFLQGTNLKQYFKLNLYTDDKYNSKQIQQKQQKLSQNNKQTQNEQDVKPNLSCLNCGQNLQNSQNLQILKNGQNNLITVGYQSQKYKQQWKQFFKPKSNQQTKQHSLALYDMI